MNKETTNGFREEILKVRLAIREQSLKDISDEIHDNIGQLLSIAKMELGTLDYADPDALRRKTEDSRDLVGKAILGLRRLTKGVDEPYISEHGLVAATEQEVAQLERNRTVETNFSVLGNPYDLGLHKELVLFSILQACLRSILHGGAPSIKVSLRYGRKVFSLSVTGKPETTPVSRKAFGPASGRGLKSRAMMIGARYRQTDRSRFIVRLPLTN